jgi:tetratricopeptide (TPR) repeat protein
MQITTILLMSFAIPSLWAQKRKSLHEMNFKEIIASYFFVADFERKIPERDISEFLFWRYPYKIGRGDFDIVYEFENVREEVPVTLGEGKPYHHLNAGRVAFLKKDYEKAKNIWLDGRRKFKNNYPYHRRMDYFIALAYLNMAKKAAEESSAGHNDERAFAYFNNASTFLAWCLFKKEDIKDPLFNTVSAKQTYNLAAIYYKFKRYAASFGASNRGLEFLRKSGRNDYHTKLSRIMAESFIQNRSYRDAIQTYDVTLRQNPTEMDAAAIFSRVGDIYFDLNNYDIAVLNYEISDKIFRDNKIIDIDSLVFLAESKFWQKKFKESNTLLRYAFSYAHKPQAKNLVTITPRPTLNSD